MTAGEVRYSMNYDVIIYIFLVLFGACVGSFLNVVIARLPNKGEFLSKKRSCCPLCEQEIKPYDLIPIFSWFVLRGKCRSCKARISFQYPLVEASGAFLACFSFWRFGFDDVTGFSFVVVFAVAAVLLAISLIDLDTTEIPNSLIISIAVCAIASIWVFPGISLLSRAIGFVAVSIPLLTITLAVNGAFGGGDIKLVAVCGFLLGWQLILLAFFLALIFGGTYAIFLMISGKRKRGEHMVFGPAICLGVAISLFYGYEIISWYTGLFMI